MKNWVKGIGASIAVLVLSAGLMGAAGHPEATLKSPVSSVAAGATMPLQGEMFLADQKVKLALQGAFNEYDLPEMTADAEGKFSTSLEIPSGVRPGAYLLVAIADDGDVVARLEVTVEGSAPAAAGHDMTAMGMGEMASAARADEMPIERSRSGMEWGMIGLLIGLSAGLGVSFLRTSES